MPCSTEIFSLFFLGQGVRVQKIKRHCWPTLCHAAKAAKWETRVLAFGMLSTHAMMRRTLMATAVITCCRWVLANPRYRLRRAPKARTLWEIVLSIPARRA